VAKSNRCIHGAHQWAVVLVSVWLARLLLQFVGPGFWRYFLLPVADLLLVCLQFGLFRVFLEQAGPDFGQPNSWTRIYFGGSVGSVLLLATDGFALFVG
jgi:hypothetical protein